MRLSASACGVLVAASISGCTTVPQKTYHEVKCGTEGCTPEELAKATERRVVQVNNTGWGTLRCITEKDRTELSKKYSPLKYYQAWLEVDENGLLTDRNQVKAIRQRIEMAHADGAPVLLTAYVHGWQGNADERLPPGCDEPKGQVNLYYAQMGRIADTVQRLYDAKVILNETGKRRKRPVVIGVWIGWRGRDYNDFTKLSSPRSFLSRGKIATAIGKKRNDRSLRKTLDILSSDAVLTDADDRMMLSGLSFGGRIITRLYKDELEQKNARPLGDKGLIVTFNAAVGSDCYEKALTFNTGGREPIVPRWINFTSQQDTLRRVLYRAGTVFVKEKEPNDEFCNSSSKLRYVALGFDKAQRTHEIFAKHDKEFKGQISFIDTSKSLNWASNPPDNGDLFYNWRDNTKYEGILDPEYKFTDYDTTGSLYRLQFSQTIANTGPLWVVNTDTSMIGAPRVWQSLNDRHSKVFTTNLFRLLVTTLYDPKRVASETKPAPTTSARLDLQVDH